MLRNNADARRCSYFELGLPVIFIYVFQPFEARTRANQANITGLGTIDL